ncbi:MAG: NHL repeat-containing protein [Planctomycetes bacterium]|nr:NHL repeat-containing protein [Planctomycetota bacterium]
MLLAAEAPGQRAPPPDDAVTYPWQVLPEDAVRGHLLEGAFREPSGVWFDARAHELFVADTKNGLIGIFDPTGRPVFTFGGGELEEPRSVATLTDGSILVLDAEQDALKRFDYRGQPTGRVAFVYPERDGVAGGRVRIGAFTVDPQGRYWVGDLDRPQLLAYSSDLELLHVVRPRRGGASFEVITGIAVSPGGLVAVTDFKATPVQVFDAEGRFLRGFGHRDIGLDGFVAPSGVAFDESGYLYAVDMLRHDVKVFDTAGVLQHHFGGWFANGSGGRAPGEMLYPSSVAVAPGGMIYVAERFGNRVQLFVRRPIDGRSPPAGGEELPAGDAASPEADG